MNIDTKYWENEKKWATIWDYLNKNRKKIKKHFIRPGFRGERRIIPLPASIFIVNKVQTHKIQNISEKWIMSDLLLSVKPHLMPCTWRFLSLEPGEPSMSAIELPLLLSFYPSEKFSCAIIIKHQLELFTRIIALHQSPSWVESSYFSMWFTLHYSRGCHCWISNRYLVT